MALHLLSKPPHVMHQIKQIDETEYFETIEKALGSDVEIKNRLSPNSYAWLNIKMKRGTIGLSKYSKDSELKEGDEFMFWRRGKPGYYADYFKGVVLE